MSKTFTIVGNDISDGYHSFTELYEHRVLLFVVLAKLSEMPAYFKRDYDEWFCLYLETPEGQISYHIPNRFLAEVETFASEDQDHKWDGHTGQDVLVRLQRLANDPS